MPSEPAPDLQAEKRFPFAIVGLVVAAALFAIMLRYDGNIVQAQQRMMPGPVSATFQQVIDGFRNFGQILNIIVFIIIIAVMESRRRVVIIAIIAGQIISGVIYNTGKYTVRRERPYLVYHLLPQGLGERQSDFTPIAIEAEKPESADWVHRTKTAQFTWQPVNKNRDTQSFPSGHSAAAFAFAGVLTHFYRRLRITIWVLAIGCAVSRVLEAMHWPSDCVAGATIGWISAQMALGLSHRICRLPRHRTIT